MKQFQNWLAHDLVCCRDGDHAMAAEVAKSICGFWLARGDEVEQAKWQKVYQNHLQQTT